MDQSPLVTEAFQKALGLALSEARRLRHECVETHHLLAGIAIEGSDVGASILAQHGFTAEIASASIEVISQAGPEHIPAPCNPDHSQRLTDVLAASVKQAESLGHSKAGTGHQLLALLDDKKSAAWQIILSRVGDPDQMRQDILSALQ
jgi:ATP-dependent Clp protease ATP-binding subunit ClpC